MRPIMQSLLDVDMYKLTMLQFIFHRHPQIPVTFGFKNRTTSVRLADFVAVEALRDELDHVRTLRFSADELNYIANISVDGITLFSNPGFHAFLSDLQLPSYELDAVDGQIALRFHGTWSEVMLWETIALGIINELYFRTQLAESGQGALNRAEQEGSNRLDNKIEALNKRPDITFIEFGTRRRFSLAWQRHVVEMLVEGVPGQIIGTSNVALAKEMGINPAGTMAHELFMVLAAHAHATEGTPEAIRASHGNVIEAWWDEYGSPLSVALTDTYGTDFAMQDLTSEQAASWKGQRQDSGSPLEFTDKMLRFYEGHGIDPSTRVAVFSDGLNLETIIEILDYVDGRLGCTFGWGTNLTNDLGYKPLSLVVKAVEASGKPTVKLSDNLAKATGPEDTVALYKSVFGYTGTLHEHCVY